MKLHPLIQLEPEGLLCLECGRAWSRQRIEDVRNQDFLWDHALAHEGLTREQWRAQYLARHAERSE